MRLEGLGFMAQIRGARFLDFLGHAIKDHNLEFLIMFAKNGFNCPVSGIFLMTEFIGYSCGHLVDLDKVLLDPYWDTQKTSGFKFLIRI